jgi:hypothetical protein
VTPDDEEFLAAFEAGRIDNQSFHHRDHLRLAWVQIRRLGVERASESVTGRDPALCRPSWAGEPLPRHDDPVLAACGGDRYRSAPRSGV